MQRDICSLDVHRDGDRHEVSALSQSEVIDVDAIGADADAAADTLGTGTSTVPPADPELQQSHARFQPRAYSRVPVFCPP